MATNNTNIYQIVITGHKKEMDVDLVLNNLATLLKRDIEIIRPLLATKKFIIKRSLDINTANKYQKFLENLGCIVVIESELHFELPKSIHQEHTFEKPLSSVNKITTVQIKNKTHAANSSVTSQSAKHSSVFNNTPNNPKNSLSRRKKQWITGIVAIIICIAGLSYKQGENNFSTSKNSETEGSVEAIMVDIPVEDETKYPLSVEPTPPPVISETQTSKPDPVPSENNLPQNASLTELSCQELWKKRNQVFHDLGYCFKQENAKAIFDNTGCKFNKAEDIKLSDAERDYVKSIRTIEENNGCLNKPKQITKETFNQPVVDSPVTSLQSPKMETFTQAAVGVNYSYNPKPKYPSVARSSGWEGKVILQVHVSADGDAQRVSVSQSSGHDILDEAAVNAVEGWRFVPAKRGDTPVATTVNVPINFKLDN